MKFLNKQIELNLEITLKYSIFPRRPELELK